MRAKSDTAIDGRSLVVVTFERQGVGAATPVIRTTFRIFTPNSVATQNTRIAVPLSCVQIDTGEQIDLTDEEYDAVLEVVAEELNSDVDW
jgi:hypothetical protein